VVWISFSAGNERHIFDFVCSPIGLVPERRAARRAAGMPLPTFPMRCQARRAQTRRSSTSSIGLRNSSRPSLASRAGARARGYLSGRGIDAAHPTQVSLGYAPRALPRSRAARKEGCPTRTGRSGPARGGEDIPLPYDRFRERVWFPIADLRTRVLACWRRARETDVPPNISLAGYAALSPRAATLYNSASARAPRTRAPRSIAPVEG